MKQKFLILIFLLSLNLPLFATHIAGGELTYRCIGGSEYEFTFVFYRDCTDPINAAAPTSISLNFESAACGYRFTISNMPRVSGTGQTITKLCPQYSSACDQGVYAMQEYVYITTTPVTLIPCPDWKIGFVNGVSGTGPSYHCCRNNPISTILSPGSQSMYVFAKLDNLNAPCNNSPKFSQKPNVNVPVNKLTVLNYGAVDPDGDSLSYSLVAPYVSPTGQVAYIPPFSASQFFMSSQPIAIDAATGIITINAQQQDLTVTAILVEEWRKIGGVYTKVGSIIRDMQMQATIGNNSLPLLSGIDMVNTQYNPNSKDYSMAICYGAPINFKIFGIDPDSTIAKKDSLTITWDSLITNASFAVVNNGTPKPYAEFSWNPTPADSGKTYRFTATIADNNCPYLGTQTFSYSITVGGITVDIGPSDTLLCSGEFFATNAISYPQAVNYYWSLNGAPLSLPPSTSQYAINSASLPPGTHVLSVNADNGNITVQCPGTDKINIHVVPQPDVDLGPDQKPCEGDIINLDAGLGNAFLWNTGASTSSIAVNADGTYMVTVDGGNGTRCIDSDTVLVKFAPTPSDIVLGSDTCISNPFVLDAGNSGVFYDWSTGDTTQAIEIAKSGSYSVTVTMDTTTNCFKTDDISITYIPDPIANLGNDTMICSHDSITLSALQQGSGYTYYWLPGGQTTPAITISNPPIGLTNVIAEVTGCITASDTLILEVKDCPAGISEKDDYPHFNIHPNPNQGSFFIEGQALDNECMLTIFSVTGRKIFEQKIIPDTKGLFRGEVDITSQPKGLYLIKLSTGNKSTFKKGFVF